MKTRHRIGLVYLPGALPCFEEFGNLPTDLVGEDAIVKGKPASEVLDLLIIPGGSLIESKSINNRVSREIRKMADAGKFVLGICSGFQVLAKDTDIGRLSSTPITRKGLGLLDVEFKPLICTDRVEATIVGKSFLTDKIGNKVTGFHCHTYGEIVLGKAAKPILVSHVQRVNYHDNPRDLISGITNKEGNVVGLSVHALLEQNPLIVQGVTKSLDINPEELQEIIAVNSVLLNKIRSEIGVSTNITSQEKIAKKNKDSTVLLMASTGSSAGKTFIATGIAGALKKRGVKLGLIKIGGDIRDSVPALYLIKEPIRSYSSIKIGKSGWKPFDEAVEEARQKYDLILIEGVMNIFTGLLNNNVEKPSSTAEVAVALEAPTIIVVACHNEGIEGAVVNTLNYVNLMRRLGIKVEGIILNKVHTRYLTDEIRLFIEKAFENANVKLLGVVPYVNLEGRGTIPEVEIRYEKFGAEAIETMENSINLVALTQLAKPFTRKNVNHQALAEKFKKLLTTNHNKL
jgi:cobyric acid synthase